MHSVVDGYMTCATLSHDHLTLTGVDDHLALSWMDDHLPSSWRDIYLPSTGSNVPRSF